MENAETKFVNDLRVSDEGPFLADWLRQQQQQQLGVTRASARAYEHIVAAKVGCNQTEMADVSPVAVKMRDLIIVAAISDAGGHHDQPGVKHALGSAFGRELEDREYAGLLGAYHQLFHGVEGAFASGMKKNVGAPPGTVHRVRGALMNWRVTSRTMRSTMMSTTTDPGCGRQRRRGRQRRNAGGILVLDTSEHPGRGR